MTQSEQASKARCLQNLSQFSVERLDKTETKPKNPKPNKHQKKRKTKPKPNQNKKEPKESFK